MAFLCPLKLVDPAKLFSINCNNKSFFWEFSLCLYNALLSLLVFPLEYFLLNEMQWYIFFLAVFLLTECIFCTYKSPAVLILTTKKRILKEQGKKYWGWNWELGKILFSSFSLFWWSTMCSARFWRNKDKSVYVHKEVSWVQQTNR